MAEIVSQSLNQDLLPLLQTERLATLSTVGVDGVPNVNAISWVYAPNPSRIYLAVNSRSLVLENIRNHQQVVLTVFGSGSIFAIVGKAKVKVERMDGVPIKLSMIQITIEEIRDVMFYGASLTACPKFEKTYDAHVAEQLDHLVLEALKNAESI